jgi:DNA-binding HxlR family transcriptional regulator
MRPSAGVRNGAGCARGGTPKSHLGSDDGSGAREHAEFLSARERRKEVEMTFANDVPAEPPALPRLRALDGGETQWASGSDREMMEAAAAAVSLISAKWKVELLFLLAAQVRRHSRLHDHLLVSKKVLSQTLKCLVRDGLVCRTVYPEAPVRIEYSLTPLGRSLTAPLYALYEWMDERAADVHTAREEYDRQNGRVAREFDLDETPRFSAAFQVRAVGAADRSAGRTQLRSLAS